jgi:hypothetical protein
MNLCEGVVLPCGISEELSSWSRFGLDEISAALRGAARAWSSADASVGDSIGRAYPVESLRGRGLDTDTIEAIITGRVPTLRVRGLATAEGEAGRDFQVAFTLFEKGFSLEEVKSVFRAHPQGCGSRWARLKEGERYLDSLFAKVTTRYGELKNYVLGGGSPEGDWVGSYKLPPGYMEHEDGSVWFQPPVKDEGRRSPALIKVSDSPIHITEIKESIDTGQIMMTLSFDYLGRTISESIPRSFMSNPRQLAGALSGLGAPVTSLNARTVTAYLTAYERHFAPSLPHKKVTSRFGRGRADGPFYLPGVAAGVEFVPAAAGDASLHRAYASRRGSLRGWLEVMRAVARETLMIPQAAVLASLVPPLQRRLRIPNFVLDLHGNTSTGKSTSLRMAASVYGRPTDPDSLVFQWMSTAAAVEQVAATCSELPVFLDDAQHCPAALKRSLIYMIANGRGKGRGERGGGGFGETLTWHTVALSTSEEPLQEASPHEGARGRLLPVGGSVPPFRAGMASLVSEVEKGIVANHGHVGEAYIRRLNGWAAEDWRRWQARYHEIRGGLLRHVSSNLAGRVSGYVAAIQLAAEVACPVI